jgi:hypothetical protein
VPSHLHLAYRRNAKAAIQKHKIRKSKNEDLLERAREDFGFFCEYVADKPPANHHREWHKQLVTNEDSNCLVKISGPNIDLLGPRGPLDPTTLVATPGGWEKLESLNKGDFVYGDDGVAVEVVNTFDYEETDLFEVIFSDGTTMRCDDSHKIDCRRMGTDTKGTYKTRTLQEIRTFVTTGIKGNWRTGPKRTVRIAEPGEKPWLDTRGHSRYQVPVSEPVQYTQQKLPISPYILGVLLGDGGLTDKRTVNFTTADEDIAERVQKELPEELFVKKHHYQTRKYSYSIQHREGAKAKTLTGVAGGMRKQLTQDLIDLELQGKSALKKHIPEIYLKGSVEQRIALLQGLMDTDGTCKKQTGYGGLSFGSSSLALIEGVTELARSLGGLVFFGKPYYPHYYKIDSDGKRLKIVSNNLAYRISLRLPESVKPFYCKRKSALYLGPCSGRSNGGLVRSIVDIKHVGRSRVRCIEVNNPQHRFLIKDYVVSNNSAKSTVLGLFTAWAIGIHTLAKQPLQILYLSYTVDIARSKSATIKRIIESKEYQQVFPTVRLMKNVTSNEYWSIDHKFAGIDNTGDEQFTLCAAGLKGSVTSKRSHLCLTGDTLVYTDRGEVPISSLYKNPGSYRVATRNHITDQIDWCKVGAVTRRRAKGIVQITTASGDCISATPEHPFITVEGRQKRAGDLSKGDAIVKLSGKLEDQVFTNQSLRSPYRSQKDKQYPSKFNNIVSPVPCSSSSNNGQSWKAEPISRAEFFGDREEYVYDLEVDHTSHNFIANGFNVLNCILDDCIKSASDIANPDVRKQMQENWNAVIAPTMFEGARAICLGTRFRHDDIHGTTFNQQNNWSQIVLPAIKYNQITGEEESYWPEMWSLDYLKEKKRQAPIAFSFQYMNEVVRQTELSLAPELIVKGEISTEFDTLGVGVDLSAGTKEKNDYTVMVLGGRIEDRIHIIDYRRLRVMGNLEKLDALKELLNDWSIIGRDDNGNYFPTYSTCDIWSESVAYQASLEADFKRICLNQEGLYNLIWHPVKGFRADKLARFRGIMGMFEDRKIIFNRFRKFTAMFEELTNFGISSHDDTVDALVWLVRGLMRKGNLHIDY